MNSSVRVTDYLSVWDYVVVGLSLALTALAARLGKRFYNREGSAVDYVLMGRRITLPIFVATLVATWYGGIFGVTEIAFEQGIFNFFTQGVFWYAAYLIFAFFLVRRLRASESLTLPELVRRMFGVRAGQIAAVFNFVNVLPIAYILSLGIFLRALTGWDLPLAIVIGALGVFAYVGVGGLASVVLPDVVQFFFMYAAVASVVGFSMAEFGGLHFLTSTLPPRYFHPQGGETLLSMFVWGGIALGTLVDPSFYQRCFAARDDRTARNGILIATVLWIGFDICTTMGGMYAAAVIPQAKASDAYLTYAVQLLPNGWRGLLIAGILATILSTIDSFAFIATNTMHYDLLGRRDYAAQGKNRIQIFVVLMVTAILALQFDGSIKRVWRFFGSFSAGCLLVPLFVKLLWPRLVDTRGFMLSVLLSLLGMSGWYLFPRTGFSKELDAIYVGFAITTLVILVGNFRKIGVRI